MINATGVILHTGLGRAPLPEAAARAVARSRAVLHRPGGRPRDRRPRPPHDPRGGHADRAHRAPRPRSSSTTAPPRSLLGARRAREAQGGARVARASSIEIGGEFRIPDILRGLRREARRGGHHEPHAHRRLSRAPCRSARAPSSRSIRRTTAWWDSRRRCRRRTWRRSPTKRGIPFLYDVGSGALSPGHGDARRTSRRSPRRSRTARDLVHVQRRQAARRPAGRRRRGERRI